MKPLVCDGCGGTQIQLSVWRASELNEDFDWTELADDFTPAILRASDGSVQLNFSAEQAAGVLMFWCPRCENVVR